jgi:hypothetical protein
MKFLSTCEFGLGVLLQFIETSIITIFGSVCTNAQFYLHSHSEKDPSSINIGVEMVLVFPPLKLSQCTYYILYSCEF